MDNTIMTCRTCLDDIPMNNPVFYLNLTQSALVVKLEECVPHIDLKITPDAAICGLCFEELSRAYKFRQKCLKTEARIAANAGKYHQSLTHTDLRNIRESSQSLHEPEVKIEIKSEEPVDHIKIKDDFNGESAVEENYKYEKDLQIVDINSIIFNGSNSDATVNNAAWNRKVCNEKLRYKCHLCNFKHNCDKQMFMHRKTHDRMYKKWKVDDKKRKNDERKIYICGDCNYQTNYKALLGYHIATIHAGHEDYFECNMCMYRSQKKCELRRHVLRLHTHKT